MRYKMRPLEERDVPVLIELVRKKSQKLGINFWLPEFSDPRTYKVFVYEDAGELLGAIVFRTVWEVIVAGDDPRIMAAANENYDKMALILDRAGVDNILAVVPNALLKPQRKSGMERLMERLGLRRSGDFTLFEGAPNGPR